MEMKAHPRLANRRARNLQASLRRAMAAHYDRENDRIVIELRSKVAISFSPHDARGLENAKPLQLQEIEITPSGFGIHFPRLDADLYLPGLLEGFLGSKQWMASRLGQRQIPKRRQESRFPAEWKAGRKAEESR